MDAGRDAQSTTSSKQMNLPGRKTERLAVAILMATLLAPVGGGLAGYPVGMGMDEVPGGHHATPAVEAAHHQMEGNGCAEHDSGESHRCAGLWSTACCDYFAPGSKVKVEPALESSSHASFALPVGLVAEVMEPIAPWGHLILPRAGEARAGPISLVILHSSLLL